jgi:drug/metabolite transporter (DMT)-like permease
VAAINVTTALSWFAVLYALDNLPPAVANSLIVGLIPVISLLLQPVLRLRAGRARSDVVSAVGCLLSVFLLIHFTLQAGSGLGALSPTSVAIGVAAAFLMALGVSTNTYVTKMLSESGFSSAETMSVRFTLLNLLAFTLTTAEGGWGSYSPQALLAIVALAVIGVFLGIYLLQIGIARTEPLQVSLLFTTNLTFTYLAQFLDPRIEQTLPVLGCVLLVTSFTAYGTLAARSRDTRPAGSATRPPVQTSSPSNQ